MTESTQSGPAGTTVSGVSPTADASTMAQAAAAMSAAATSLSENMAKFASLTENISKIAESVTDKNVDSNDTNNDARGIVNDFDTVRGIGHIEAQRAHMGRLGAWFDREIASAQAHTDNVRQVILRGMGNGAESDNMIGKQAVRHADTQLFETSMGEAAEVNVALGSVVNDLLAATESLKAVADTMKMAAPAMK